MPGVYYFPRKRVERVFFLRDFALALPTYATKYGISPAQLTDIQESATYLIYLLDCDIALRSYDKSVTAFFKWMTEGGDGDASGLSAYHPPAAPAVAVPKKGIFVRLLKMVKGIKNHPSYDATDGAAMGIEASHPHKKNLSELVPLLTAELLGTGVLLTAKKGNTQGYEVWCDRGTGSFTFIGFSTGRKYLDTTERPAQGANWKYKVIYHIGNQQAGQWSTVVTVHVW
jgi:hypothetical protein